MKNHLNEQKKPLTGQKLFSYSVDTLIDKDMQI